MLTLADVHDLATTLQASGETISANKIVEHRGGSKRDALKLMRLYRAETHEPPTTPGAPVAVLEPAMVPEDAAPVSAAPEVGPPTRLAQAEEALRQATWAEREARRTRDLGGSSTDAEVLRLAQARRQAQDLVDARQRAKARLIAEIPTARIDVRRTAGELAALEDETHRRLLRARREAQQAQEELDRLEQDLTQIAGAQAVPPKDA
jgi:hypothetical protein